jgi:hypothetical protein
MSQSSHAGDGDLTQNQNNAMSEDPGDGQRRRYSATADTPGIEGAPEQQGGDTLAEFGKRGSRQD